MVQFRLAIPVHGVSTPFAFVIWLLGFGIVNNCLIPALLALLSLNAVAVSHYVDLNSPNPTPPYLEWTTAATNIQDAIDAAVDGDLVLVTNGVYNTGGRTNGASYLTNRVVVSKPLTLQSVNGPSTTAIEGYQVPGTVIGNSAVRCVYLTNGATLIGFAITNGSNRGDGIQLTEQAAGIFCASSDAVISNCVIVGNVATGFGQAGGGVFGGTLFDCLLVGNKAAGGGAACNSVLYNCTVISNTATSLGGGVLGNAFGGLNGSVLNNCVVEFNSAPSGGGFAGVGTLNNCWLRSNTATAGNGGGASQGVFSNCVFAGNQALGNSAGIGMGGGAYFSSLDSCTVSNNVAGRTGGGADGGNLTRCIVTANTASIGGGINRAALYNCVVSGNAASVSGGGASSNFLVNCVVTGNAARVSGGGSYSSSLTNCVVTGNSAPSVGGVSAGAVRNSIVYYNFALTSPNYLGNTMNYCCTIPLPVGGVGNLAEPPQLADSFHLGATSPCIGAGDASSASGTDLDGQAWNIPPAIGCDEYYSGTATGLLSVVMMVGANNSTTGFATNSEGSLFAMISGNASSNFWDFGDGSFATNQPYATHSWAAPGPFVVKVWVYNDDHPLGVSAERTIQVVEQPVHYVDTGNASPAAPYLSWETAATNIQDAVDAAFGGGSVLVSNGVYRFGGKIAYDSLSNRVAVTKPLAVRSVNGPLLTIIQGYQVPGTTNGDAAMRCVFLTNGASLAGFTLTNGATFAFGSALGKSDQDFSGGGIWCVSTNEMISNCVVVANTASYWGAGVYSGTLKNCTLSNNKNYNGSPFGGGGAYLSTMSDCIVSGNRANIGGGVHSVVMNNCLVISNSSAGAHSSTLNQCTIIGNTGGGVDMCTLVNCVVESNSATSSSAGGANSSTLRDCMIIGNSAIVGGGLNNSTATNCFISGNKGGGANNSALNNCTLSANTAQSGAGASGLSSRLTNCVISGNWATNAGGGAASGAILVNCLVTGNSANTGGGVFSCTLINATVVSNTAVSQGGGAHQGTLRNSIIYFNSAATSPNIALATVNNTCTIPAVAGAGNFTNAPRFVDQSAGNFRLQTNSPCIGTGNNVYTSIAKDLDGRPRIVGGVVDVGAYEFQASGIGEFIAWLQDSGFLTDGSADFTDADGDAMSNYGEWRSGTIPTNALSVLRMVNATNSSNGAKVTWQSVSTRNYWLERATDLGAVSPFQSIATDIVGSVGTKTFTDTSATNGGPYFYRVGVQ